MSEKPIPEFMMKYMENIGDNCYGDYDRLAQQFHKAIDHYHEHTSPRQGESMALFNKAFGKRDSLNIDAALTGISETYKEKSLNLASEKYGYEIPDMEDHEHVTDEFGKSYQDIVAGKAHERYEAKNAIIQKQRELNRDIIEFCFGENRVQNLEFRTQNPRQERADPQQDEKPQETPEIEEEVSIEIVEETPKKNESVDPNRYEQQLSSFAGNQKDILNDKHAKAFKENKKDMTTVTAASERIMESKDSTAPDLGDLGRGANRFIASLSSERQQSDMESIDLHMVPKGKDGVDLERD